MLIFYPKIKRGHTVSIGSIVLIVIVLFLIIGVFTVISIYNGLVKNQNYYKNNFAQIDVQLNRRYDLIPNLVETAKAYMQHESETLEKVIQARNEAHSVASQLGQNPLNTEMLSKLMASENSLGQSMMNFRALMENYPDLKANQTMQQLMEELTSTENKIAFARQAYNDSVMSYNTSREVFPSNILAGMFNFQQAVYFEVQQEARQNVKVNFS